MLRKSNDGTTLYRIYSLMLAFAGAVGIQGTMALGMADNIRYTNSLLSVLIFVFSGIIFNEILPSYLAMSKRETLWSIGVSFLLSLALHIGARMEASDSVRIVDVTLWMQTIFLALYLSPIVGYIWNRMPIIMSNILMDDEHRTDNKRFRLLSIWGVIFVLWIPTFLALYPGAFVYDAQEEYVEVISRTFTMHHPLLHVLSLGGTVHAAEYFGFEANVGIATYVIIQMLIFSFILAYSVRWIYRRGVKKGYCFGVMLTYGLFPIFPMYAVCTAKDTLFSAFLLLIALLLSDYALTNYMNNILFVIASTLMMLLRNNGLYAYIVMIPIASLLLLAGKSKRASEKESDADMQVKRLSLRNCILRLIVLMILSVVLAVGINETLKIATKASDNEHQEILTVPIQQLARVYTYNKEVFSSEELETLYEVLPEEYLGTYALRVSDIVKSGFDNFAYEKNPGKYRRLWFDIGCRKPIAYVNAWLGTSYGYWYPDAINNVYMGNQMYTFQYDKSSYFGFETEPPGYRASKFALLERFYRELSLSLYQQKVPVVSMLFSPGFMFWIFALVLTGLLVRGNIDSKACGYNRAMPLCLIGLVWLTVMLGPTTLVRYVLILWLIMPLLPAFVVRKSI